MKYYVLIFHTRNDALKYGLWENLADAWAQAAQWAKQEVSQATYNEALEAVFEEDEEADLFDYRKVIHYLLKQHPGWSVETAWLEPGQWSESGMF